MVEVIQILCCVFVGFSPPLILIAVWRRWQNTSKLVTATILLPFLSGLVCLCFGAIFAGLFLQQNPTFATRGVMASRPFWFVFMTFCYGIFGGMITLGSYLLWGPIWYAWLLLHPESLWKMVYFRQRGHAEIKKDYDEEIKPESPSALTIVQKE